MRHILRDNRGFTLADILISMLVMSLLAGGIVAMLLATSRTYATGSEQQDSQQNARLVLAYLSKQIEACPGDDLVLNLPTYDPAHPTTGSTQIAVYDPSTSGYVQGYYDYNSGNYVDANSNLVSLVRFRYDSASRKLYRDSFGNSLLGKSHLSDLTGQTPVASVEVATDLDNVVFTNATGLTGGPVHIYVAARPYGKSLKHQAVYETAVAFH